MKKFLVLIRRVFALPLLLVLIALFPLILIAILIRIIPSFIIDKISNTRCEKMEDNTIEEVKSKMLGFYISIQGIVRAGKTALAVFLSNVTQLILIDDINNQIEFFRTLNWEIDFNEMDNDILELKHNDRHITAKQIRNKLYPKYKELLDQEHDFGNKKIKGNKYFNKYIKAVMRSEDTHFAFASIDVISAVTGTKSLEFNPDNISLKECQENKSYVLTNYLVILDDDKQIQTDKSNKNYLEVAKEDKGASLFFRLIGNMFEETVYYITTSQNAEGIVKEERILANSQITIYEKCRAIGNYSRTRSTIHSLVNYLKTLNNVYCLTTSNCEEEKLKPNIFKYWIYQLFIKDFKLDSKGYVLFPCNILIGGTGDTATELQMNFVASKKWSFDCYDTHAFKFFHEYLEEDSEINFYDELYKSVEDDREKFKRIIKKNVKRKEEKENVAPVVKDAFIGAD